MAGNTAALKRSASASNVVNAGEEDCNLEVAKNETIAVRCLRVTVVVGLLLVMVVLSLLTFYLLRRHEVGEFHDAFDSYVDQLFSNFHRESEDRLKAIHTLAMDVMSYAIDTDATWPFVTVPDFEARAAAIRSLTGASILIFSPLVTQTNRQEYERYTIANSGWMQESKDLQEAAGIEINITTEYDFSSFFEHGFSPMIFAFNDIGFPTPETSNGPFFPGWQVSPLVPQFQAMINMNLLNVYPFQPSLETMLERDHVTLGAAETVNLLTGPSSGIYYPIYDSFNKTNLVASLGLDISWKPFFERNLPPNAKGITCVVENDCGGTGQLFTYEINGENTVFVGEGDMHDTKFDNMRETALLQEPAEEEHNEFYHVNDDFCNYVIHVYPTQKLKDNYITNRPTLYLGVIAALFGSFILMFMYYNYVVEQRQELVMAAAIKSGAIVASIFPARVRDKIFKSTKARQGRRRGRRRTSVDGEPNADLYPETTVMFAEIMGFGVWSAEREPVNVFTLLETLYGEFDELAKEFDCFKVETVAQYYVAVTGLPAPQEEHASIIAEFAKACIERMKEVTEELEVKLGPDTADLELRIGLHSGPVTAGVLKGGAARFQLFGDTVNMASRMQSNGRANLIHASGSTMDALRKTGFGNWAIPRDEKVFAKGKGTLQTYWIDVTRPITRKSSRKSGRMSIKVPWSRSSHASTRLRRGRFSNASSKPPSDNRLSLLGVGSAEMSFFEDSSTFSVTGNHGKSRRGLTKKQRLVKWNTDLLIQQLKEIVAKRNTQNPPTDPSFRIYLKDGKTYIDELKETISLPRFEAPPSPSTPNSVQLDPKVEEQMRDVVERIAALYRENAFHNFEHASHATMSADKFLKRMLAGESLKNQETPNASDLHDSSFGLSSDPLAQFAIIFSALVHDVDHPAVPNMQLIAERGTMATRFKNKSVAEQNSIDIALDILTDPAYKEMRGCLFETRADFIRFRQLLINSVLATDIFDKDLSTRRKLLWSKAVTAKENGNMTGKDMDRMATIVIEYVMQASDIAHMMQHWSTYTKWNKCLFEEMYKAYKKGRMGRDPSEFWYLGELAFFDGYVIPLAKKIQQCGVFGVASDECLKHAEENRKLWKETGEAIVEDLVDSADIDADVALAVRRMSQQ